jgi:hypothetical protein
LISRPTENGKLTFRPACCHCMRGISAVIAARRAGVAVYRAPAMVHERVIAPGSSSVRYSTACGSAPGQSS